MSRHLHSTGPASSAPNNGVDGGGDGSEALVPPTEPRPSGLPLFPLFSSLARGQHPDLLHTRPRLRQRDARPSAQKQKSTPRSSITQEPIQSLSSEALISQAQSPGSHLSNQPQPQQHTRPSPLPSPPISTPHNDIRQLADTFSRHRLELAPCRNDGHTFTDLTAADDGSSRFEQFDCKMSDLRLQAGGNAPVSDLEVDLCLVPLEDGESTGDMRMQTERPLSPGAAKRHIDKPPSALRDSDKTQAAGSRRVNGKRPLYSRHMSPVVEEPLQPTDTITLATATGVLPMAPTSTPGVEAAAVSVGASDPARAAFPSDSTHHDKASVSQPPVLPPDVSRPRSVSRSDAGSATLSVCLPLSHDSLALPRHAPVHSDVPSSSYDLRGWLESSCTVEAAPGQATGTAGSSNMTSVYLAEAMLSRETRQPQSEPLHTACRLRQRLPYCVDKGDKGDPDVLNGPNPPVTDLEVDMVGNDAASAASAAVIEAESPATLGASQRQRSPSSVNVDSGLVGPILAAYLEYKSIRSRAEAVGGHVSLSQRILMAHMEVECETSLRQAGHLLDDTSMDDVPTSGGYMDVEMRDPAEDTQTQQNGGQRYTGPLRYHLSADVALRCANLVHSRPRMRRRRTDPKSGAATATGSGRSSTREGSARDGMDAASTQSKDNERQHRSSTQDRRNRMSQGRELIRQSSRSLLAQSQARLQARYEASAEARSYAARQTADAGPPATSQ